VLDGQDQRFHRGLPLPGFVPGFGQFLDELDGGISVTSGRSAPNKKGRPNAASLRR